ncbi:hypothetical protein D3C72_2228760 [compost metagenome]
MDVPTICTGALATMPPGSWNTMRPLSMSTDHCSASSRCQAAQCAVVAACMPSMLWAMKAWTSKGVEVSDMLVELHGLGGETNASQGFG